MENAKEKVKVYFPNLDALRTIAFLFVFSEHVLWSAFKNLNIQDRFLLDFAYNIFANGGLGVSIFFVLSGFLITYLILTEIKFFGKLDLKSFYIRRTLRIWPLYFLVIAFVFAGIPFVQHFIGHPQENPADLKYYFSFLSNFDLIRLGQAGAIGNMQSGITWSVGIEEQFYLLWPLLFLFLPVRFYLPVFLSIVAFCLFFRFQNVHDPIVIYFHSFAVCADLALGGLIAYMVMRKQEDGPWTFHLEKWKVLIIYFLGISFVFLGKELFAFPMFPVFSRLISTIFFGFIILDQNFNTAHDMKLSKLKVLSTWGKYTYGMYLLHPIAFYFVKLLTDFMNLSFPGFFPRFGLGMFVLVVTGFISYLSYHWIEKKFLLLKEKFSYTAR